MSEVEAGITKTTVQRIMMVLVFPRRNRGGNSVERLRVESHGLAHFTCRHTIAIGDNVSRHCRPAITETLVDVLNSALALVTARQINIDIRPLAALFREKTLEK